MNTELTQEKLKKLLHYDPESGVFVWIKGRGGVRAGSVAGSLNKDGYIAIRIDKKSYGAHRLAWLYVHGYFPEDQVDHINRIRNVNRISNLREASQQCQARNRSTAFHNTSGVKGVKWNKKDKKWISFIDDKGMKKYIGSFVNKLEAACARYAAEQCLGYQDCDIASSAMKFIKMVQK